jgi:tetratricopeptide (TPR) repeat protein
VAKLRGGDARGAAVLLETITKREPKNAKAWRALGAASKQTKDYPRAIAAFRQAATLDPANPMPLYQIGTVYALEKKPAEAFTWLRKAKATHRIDMSQIDGDAALASLKDDPRFAALRPSPADFEHPFVEPVTILREWRGEHAGDQFGWIARAIGDVDGDGITDIVTSAPGHTTDGAGGGANGGRIYAYSPGSGKLLWTADGQAGDQLGTGVEGAGDIDGDGNQFRASSAEEPG